VQQWVVSNVGGSPCQFPPNRLLRPSCQAFVIVNLKTIGLSQFRAFKFIARCFFNVSQNYFPETYMPALLPSLNVLTHMYCSMG